MDEQLKNDSVMFSIKNQLYAALVANCIILSQGTVIGWLSSAIPVLLSDDTPLKTGSITNEELSWIGAMNSVGAICGTFICGAMSALIGSKRAMIYLAYPVIAFWILIYFGNDFYHILAARFFTGLTTGGFQSGVVLYVSEISSDNVRGRLGSILPVAKNTGIFLAYIAGAVIKYEYRPFLFIPMPIIYLIWVNFLPNTPQYYLQNESYQKAEKALMYYKACNFENKREIMLLKAEFERIKILEEDRKKNPKVQLKDFCNKMALKGIITSIAMSWFFQATGCFIITNYASLIFDISGTSLSIEVSTIILAAVQIAGGLVSTQMGDAFGRKTTLFISLIGSALGLFIFAVYSYLRQNDYDVSNYLWVPELCLSFLIFISSSGIVALANTCTIENFPPKIRPAGMAFYSLTLNGVALLGEKFFPVLVEVIYLHGCLLFLAANCCLGLIFVAIMKETKGKSINSIKSS